MTRTIKLLAPALFLMMPAGAAMADSHTAGCSSMLATTVGMDLAAEGFDMVDPCTLTVSQLATIKNLLETEGMSARLQIQAVLSR